MARLERELAELKSQVKTNSSSKVTPTTSSLHSSSERKRSSVAAAVGSNGCPSSKRRSLVKEDEEGVVMRRRGGAKARLAHASDDENCFTDRFSGIKIRCVFMMQCTCMHTVDFHTQCQAEAFKF